VAETRRRRWPGAGGGAFWLLVGQVSVVLLRDDTIFREISALFLRCGAAGRDKSADSNDGRVWRHVDTVHCEFVGAGGQLSHNTAVFSALARDNHKTI